MLDKLEKFEKFSNRVVLVEEHLKQLVETSNLVYDSSFHKAIVKEVNKINEEIMESELEMYDKILLLSYLTEIHKESLESMKRII